MATRLAVAVLALCAALCAAPAPVVLAGGSGGSGALSGDEEQAFGRVNASRQAAGLPALELHAGLVSIARSQAAAMVSAGMIFHTADLAGAAAAAGVSWTLLGENVGTGPGVEAVHGAFLASPGHRQNILEPRFTAVGVGVARSGGSVYVTQSFASLRESKPATPPAPAPAPSAQAAPPPPPPAASVPAARAPAKRAPAPKPAAPEPAPSPTQASQPPAAAPAASMSPSEPPQRATAPPAALGDFEVAGGGGQPARERPSMVARVAAAVVSFFDRLSFWK